VIIWENRYSRIVFTAEKECELALCMCKGPVPRHTGRVSTKGAIFRFSQINNFDPGFSFAYLDAL
jgi:hypothetical protein